METYELYHIKTRPFLSMVVCPFSGSSGCASIYTRVIYIQIVLILLHFYYIVIRSKTEQTYHYNFRSNYQNEKKEKIGGHQHLCFLYGFWPLF